MTLAVGALIVGCGGSEKPAPSGGGAAATADEGCGCAEGCGCGEEAAGGGGGDCAPDQGTAAVKGVVKFEGEAPPARQIDVGSEAFCVQYYKDSPLMVETVVVGADGAVANVFVQITAGLDDWKFPAGSGEVLLDQKGCRYVPHIVGAQVGQSLKVRNSDPIMHNVHGINMRTNKDEFNWAQAKAGLESTKELKRAGGILVKCDVHGWMGSYVWVVKHPFFAVTGEDGAFELPKLPPGTYTIEAWHEKLGTQTQKVTVGDGETKEITLTFSLD